MTKSKLNATLLMGIFLLTVLLGTSCKSKKIAIQPKEEPVVEVKKQEPIVEVKKEVDTDGDGIVDEKDNCPDEKGSAANNGCPVEVEKPFNFKNIQFEFNSSVLKTSSYATLDEISREMKKHPNTVYQLNGHSSEEGTAKRNMMLSVDRAAAVKAYLVNNGIKNANLIVKGFGETMPLVPNTTEANRALNRRVEIKSVQ
ncbi:OmpA family protein [Pelobium sp.]|nr:OmpA family protein [Pelobium sp.]MDA9555104.1 OmpA family protein [Pelobium sp.]